MANVPPEHQETAYRSGAAIPCTTELRIQPYNTPQAKAGTLFLSKAPDTAIHADGQLAYIAAMPELFAVIGHTYTPKCAVGYEYDKKEVIAHRAGWGVQPVPKPVYQWQHPPQGMFYLPSLLSITA